jgi:hypothetical protein
MRTIDVWLGSDLVAVLNILALIHDTGRARQHKALLALQCGSRMSSDVHTATPHFFAVSIRLRVPSTFTA